MTDACLFVTRQECQDWLRPAAKKSSGPTASQLTTVRQYNLLYTYVIPTDTKQLNKRLFNYIQYQCQYLDYLRRFSFLFSLLLFCVVYLVVTFFSTSLMLSNCRTTKTRIFVKCKQAFRKMLQHVHVECLFRPCRMDQKVKFEHVLLNYRTYFIVERCGRTSDHRYKS